MIEPATKKNINTGEKDEKSKNITKEWFFIQLGNSKVEDKLSIVTINPETAIQSTA